MEERHFNGAPLSQETLVYAPPRMGLAIFLSFEEKA